MLNIEHLTKTYGEKKAVDDLNLHIRPGEIYGFIGHNGAGKTTTLKSVAGILQFDAGEIYIGGDSVREKPLECKRKIAYIPDNPDLYEYMTGIRYLNFIADIFGVDAALRRDALPLRRQLEGDDLPGLHPAVGQDGGAVGKKAAAPEFHGPGQVGGDAAPAQKTAQQHPIRLGRDFEIKLHLPTSSAGNI